MKSHSRIFISNIECISEETKVAALDLSKKVRKILWYYNCYYYFSPRYRFLRSVHLERQFAGNKLKFAQIMDWEKFLNFFLPVFYPVVKSCDCLRENQQITNHANVGEMWETVNIEHFHHLI